MTLPVDEGLCELCHQRPAQYLEIICLQCKDAVDNGEPWTLAFEDVLSRLQFLEAEEDYR